MRSDVNWRVRNPLPMNDWVTLRADRLETSPACAVEPTGTAEICNGNTFAHYGALLCAECRRRAGR